MVSGSYIEQNATSFRPRVDRDNLQFNDIDGDGVDDPFLAIQFLVQEVENNLFENVNFAGTGEWAPNDELKFYVDGFFNSQDNNQESVRLQASGISTFAGDVIPTSTETVSYTHLTLPTTPYV